MELIAWSQASADRHTCYCFRTDERRIPTRKSGIRCNQQPERVGITFCQLPRGLREELCMDRICQRPPTFLSTLVATPSRSIGAPVLGSIV
jgi:hypothetical protein